MATVYQIANWNELYENNRTRELKRLEWVPVPIKHDGDGYTELVEHPDGAAHFGCWVAILQIAAKCDPRGTLLRDGAKPHDVDSICRITRLPRPMLKAALDRLIGIGWVVANSIADQVVTTIPQEGARIPQGGADKRLWNGMEGNGREGNTPLPPKGDATAKKPKTPNAPSEAFAAFWTRYPSQRKADKSGAWKKWQDKKLDAIAEEVMAGLSRWLASEDWRRQGGQYIPGPVPWLNQEKWLAYPTPAPDEQDMIDGVPITPPDAETLAAIAEWAGGAA